MAVPCVRFRAGEERDGAAARSARHEALRALPAGTYTPSEVEAWLRAGVAPEPAAGTAFVVAEVEAALVGYGYARGGRLEELYVHPRHQGHGVGSGLLERIEHLAGETIEVQAIPSAASFYAARGYREVGVATLWLSVAHRVEVVWMRKHRQLDPPRELADRHRAITHG